MSNLKLLAAIAKLPDLQVKRIYTCYFLEMTKTEIARAEGVSVKAVCKSIAQALRTLEKEFKNFEG